ncbi:MAG: DUF1330 domain-containing protein, partial [Cellulomonas sp.]|nr:DUF1330 domain-containing protein [Cellulomonas sp.]
MDLLADHHRRVPQRDLPGAVVEDPHGDYIAANAAVFAKYGARFIVRGGPFDAPEGVARARNVVLEFPSLQAAR